VKHRVHNQQQKEEILNKTHAQDRSFNTRVLQAPAALGKFSFKAKEVSKKQFLG
jgi:hypothetical protein